MRFISKMRHLCVLLYLVYFLVQLSFFTLPLATGKMGSHLANATCKHNEFYINGSLIFSGLFPIHYAPQNTSTSKQCQGKFNTRGFEEALAMLYAIKRINNDSRILPGITIGADIKDTCSSVDFAIRKCLNFSFIRNNMEDTMCEKKTRLRCRSQSENSRHRWSGLHRCGNGGCQSRRPVLCPCCELFLFE